MLLYSRCLCFLGSDWRLSLRVCWSLVCCIIQENVVVVVAGLSVAFSLGFGRVCCFWSKPTLRSPGLQHAACNIRPLASSDAFVVTLSYAVATLSGTWL